MRQLGNGEEAAPLEPPVSRHRHQAIPVLADRRDAGALPADRPAGVSPDPIQCWHAREGQRGACLAPRARLIETQAGEIRGTTRLEPRCAQRHGHALGAIGHEYGTMPCVLQGHHHRGGALHTDRIDDLTHALTGAAIPIRPRIVRVERVGIQIFGIDTENGQSPCAVLVVSDSHARNGRLATTDHVPTRRLQMHHVAQRRRGNRAMRIIRHDRLTTGRTRARNHPVVALPPVETRRSGIRRWRRTSERVGQLGRAKIRSLLKVVVRRQHARARRGIKRPRHQRVEPQSHG